MARTDVRGKWHAVAAGYLGWTMDAFDFFVVIFLYDTLAAHFHVPKSHVIWATTATLAFRPVGAVIFGLLADRYGRRAPLIGNVLFFSSVGFACGFAPNFTVFFILRCLYGIGMGGEWGVGASLAMENAPKRWRGLLSGILQSGYSMGYLLAAIAARSILPNVEPDMAWRWMFWIGGAPALLALYIRTKVPESEAWKAHRLPDFKSILRTTAANGKLFAYLIAMMTLFMFLSHGTQDLYPDFLKNEHGVSDAARANMAIFYNIGAIVGAIIFGEMSEKIGRRYAIAAALFVCLCVIPFWTFGSTVWVLAAASFLMQVGVQGAWGIVPAHLNEMSPDAVRGLVPGLAYQLGILFASPTSNMQHKLMELFGYKWALAGFELFVIVSLATVVHGLGD
jgi:SHS family lactate transporter-like MFS transporter